MIEADNNEEAAQIQELVKAIYVAAIELLKSEEPDYEKDFGTIHLITSLNANKVSLFVTTSNEAWMELGLLASEFLDKILGVQINLTADVRVNFSFDFDKFVTDPDYNVYEMFTKNSKTEIKWKCS